MHRSLALCIAAVALASASIAQTHVTAPAGYLTKPGTGDGELLGIHPRISGRTQIVDPSFPRGKILTLTGVAWRCDETLNYDSKLGTGRKFSSVSYSLAHSDCAKFQKTFSANYIGTPSKVFTGSMSFPSFTGKCKQAWGNVGSIKFSKPFMFSGVDDLLQEWSVSNGTLDNKSTAALASYGVDGSFGTSSLVKQLYGGSPYAPGSRFLPSPPGEGQLCADSQQPSGSDAYTSVRAEVYANNHPSNLRGLVKVTESRSFGMAKKAPYVGGLTMGGFDLGLGVGALCHKQFVSLTFPVIVFNGMTDNLGRTPNYLPTDAVLYINGYEGLPIFAQAAWTESKSGFVALTKGVKIVLPAKPDGTYYGHKKVCYLQTYKNEKGVTMGPISGESVDYNAVERFSLK